MYQGVHACCGGPRGNQKLAGTYLISRSSNGSFLRLQHLPGISSVGRILLRVEPVQLHAEPLATDFHLFLMEAHREAAPGN